MRPRSAIVPKKGTERWLYEILRHLQLDTQAANAGLNAIVRGEVPDGSGDPLPGGDGGPEIPGDVGAVLFVGPGPVLATSPAEFFWDDTNNFLGVGTAVPIANLHVEGGGDPELLRGTGSLFNNFNAVGTAWPTCVNEEPSDGDGSYIETNFDGGTRFAGSTLTEPTDLANVETVRIHAIMRRTLSTPLVNGQLSVGLYNSGQSIGYGAIQVALADLTTSYAEYTYDLTAAEVALFKLVGVHTIMVSQANQFSANVIRVTNVWVTATSRPAVLVKYDGAPFGALTAWRDTSDQDWMKLDSRGTLTVGHASVNVDYPKLVIQGATAQAGDLLRVYKGTTLLSRIDSAGKTGIGTGSTGLTGALEVWASGVGGPAQAVRILSGATGTIGLLIKDGDTAPTAASLQIIRSDDQVMARFVASAFNGGVERDLAMFQGGTEVVRFGTINATARQWGFFTAAGLADLSFASGFSGLFTDSHDGVRIALGDVYSGNRSAAFSSGGGNIMTRIGIMCHGTTIQNDFSGNLVIPGAVLRIVNSSANGANGTILQIIHSQRAGQTANLTEWWDSSAAAIASISAAGAALFTGLTLNAANIITDTSTGLKIATATNQKLGFWNTAPNVQPTTGITAATFVANTSAIADDSATFDGYTIGQVVAALRRAGLLA